VSLLATGAALLAGGLAQGQNTVAPAARQENPFILSPQLEAIRAANVQSLSSAGYVDRDEEPRTEYVQARMRERESALELAGQEKTPRARWASMR
jgi:hypothetical protein